MKQYARIFRYLKGYTAPITFYFISTFLSIIFSIVSIGMLMPFLNLIFNDPRPECANCGSAMKSSSNFLIRSVNDFLGNSVAENGKVKTLAIICVMMILFVIFKNLFLYLANYVLNPLKNKIVNRMREDVFDKVLTLPIGFFNEKRKGDIMSRMTNDIGEVEGSLVGTLEGWIRDPLTILVTLIALLSSVHA